MTIRKLCQGRLEAVSSIASTRSSEKAGKHYHPECQHCQFHDFSNINIVEARIYQKWIQRITQITIYVVNKAGKLLRLYFSGLSKCIKPATRGSIYIYTSGDPHRNYSDGKHIINRFGLLPELRSKGCSGCSSFSTRHPTDTTPAGKPEIFRLV